jgi:hypothetical protein
MGLIDIRKHTFFLESSMKALPVLELFIIDPQFSYDGIMEHSGSFLGKLNKLQRYIIIVHQHMYNLANIIERIDYSHFLLCRAPYPNRTKAVAFNRNSWIDYNFYIYTTSLTGLLDCLILLTAKVFQIGFPPRLCSFELITNYQYIKNAKLKKDLCFLKEALKAHTSRRNRFIHRGDESNILELTDARQYYFLRGATELDNFNKLIMPRKTMQSMWKTQIKELKVNLSKDEAKILLMMKNILDELLPIYNQYNRIIPNLFNK